MKPLACVLLFAAFAHYLCLWVKMPASSAAYVFPVCILVAFLVLAKTIDESK